MSQLIQMRRGTASQWTVANPVLHAAELGVETDTLKFKVGDGVTAWTALAYANSGGGGGGTGDDVAGDTHGASSKSTPVAADEFPMADSASLFTLRKVTFANIKAAVLSGLTSASVGLGNVTNTSDANKPVSTTQQAALDLKLPISGVQAAVEGALPGAVLMVYYNTGSSAWPTLATSLSTDSAISWHFVGGDVSHAPPTVSGNAVWDRPT